jgi:hypothetical protein
MLSCNASFLDIVNDVSVAVLRCGVGVVLKVYIFFFLIQVDGGSEMEVEVASYGE